MAKPISVSPSQAWLGNDGRWSTFNIRVGTPAQDIWVIPSTRIPETWVVLNDGCISSDPVSCPDDRGHTFKPENSSTWKQRGLYSLGVESNLGYDATNAGNYGFDTLGLGYRGAGGPTLEAQVIAGIATKDFYLGSLGLFPAPVNFTSEDSSPSLLANLKAQNLIPSLSYGYSAGAYYRLKKVDGTLTLGGYDASRLTPNDVDFTLASDISRDLVVGVQSIRFSDSETPSEELLEDGIFAFIDSTVPHIWLPLSSCRAFEKAFGIQYDDATDLYLVSDKLHTQLESQNASVTFVLGNDVTGGQTVEITLPYLSFDLEAKYKFLNKSSKYFPLRRANNDTQYTLGRTFLQESYLTVDYERSTFSVSQSVFSEVAEPKLTPILPPSDDVTIMAKPQPSNPSKKLSPGAVAGIVVAVVTLCLLAFGTFFFIRRRRRRRSEDEPRSSRLKNQVELDGIQKPAEADDMAARKPGLEMEGNNTPTSLDVRFRNAAEVPGSNAGVEIEGSRGGVEMEGGTQPAAFELDAGPIPIHEMPSPNNNTTTLTDSIASGRGTPSSRPNSRNSRRPHSNLRNSRLQSPADSEDISPLVSSPGRSNEGPDSSVVISPQTPQVLSGGPGQIPSGGAAAAAAAEQAEVETGRERRRGERWTLRRRTEE